MTTTQAPSRLNEQIQAMLGEYNLPQEVIGTIMTGMRQVAECGLARGLEIGAAAPDFRLSNQHGDMVSLAEKLARGPVVLKFYRGDWCPICNLELKVLQEALPELRAENASLLAINLQLSEKSRGLVEKHDLGFDLLSDESQQVTRSYGLLFTMPPEVQKVSSRVFGISLPEHNAEPNWNLPIPATFVIDREGIVRARHVDTNYIERMDPQEILQALRSLA